MSSAVVNLVIWRFIKGFKPGQTAAQKSGSELPSTQAELPGSFQMKLLRSNMWGRYKDLQSLSCLETLNETNSKDSSRLDGNRYTRTPAGP